MRFAVMQGTPGYRQHETSAEEPVTGQEGTLLRLLLLRRGRPLTTEEIARHLTRSGKRTVSPSSVPGYVGRLRGAIGYDRIRSTAGYCSAIDETEVDAFVFENLIEEYGVCEIADIDDVDSAFNDRYEHLLDLHAMWHANPADQFADDQDDEFLTGAYLDFERYWDCLKRCIIFSELRSRRKPRIEKAIGRIEQLLRQDPHDEQLWALLFRARASLPGHDAALASMQAEIRQKFPRGIPGELNYTIGRIVDGHTDALFEIDVHRRMPEDQRRLEDLIGTVGISSASELELRRSKLEPLECIRQTVSRLSFAGILGTKWVADSFVRAEFARLLERLDGSGGSVRFLLIDPESEAYQRFSALRWSMGADQPISMLRSLSAAHPSFQVRLYDALPTFRIVLIDQSVASFSPYLMAPGTERARTGWEAPHIVLDRTAPWPLAQTFETLFEEAWRTATPLPPAGEPAALLTGDDFYRGDQLVIGRDKGQRALRVRDVGVIGAAQQVPGQGHVPFPQMAALAVARPHDGSHPVQVRGDPGQRGEGCQRAWCRGNCRQVRLAGTEPGRKRPPGAETREEHGLGAGIHTAHQQVDRQPRRVSGPMRDTEMARVDQLRPGMASRRDQHVRAVQVSVCVADVRFPGDFALRYAGQTALGDESGQHPDETARLTGQPAAIITFQGLPQFFEHLQDASLPVRSE